MRFALYSALVLATALAPAAGQEKSDASAWIRIEAPAKPIEFGRRFELRIVQSFERRWRAEPRPDHSLAPLDTLLVKHEQSEKDGRITESFEFSCYCFLRGLVTLPPPKLRLMPRAGGPSFVIEGKGCELAVKSALTPDASAKLEALRGPFPAPFSWRPWIISGLLLLPCLLAVLWYLRYMQRRRNARATQEVLPPHRQALQLVEELRKRHQAGFAALRQETLACSALLRSYLAWRFGWTSEDRTTEELLSDPRFAELEPMEIQQDLRCFLEHCDAVKYAAHEPAATERANILERIARFIRVTSQSEEAA